MFADVCFGVLTAITCLVQLTHVLVTSNNFTVIYVQANDIIMWYYWTSNFNTQTHILFQSQDKLYIQVTISHFQSHFENCSREK